MNYYGSSIVFKKNPHNLKVGKLYQLYYGTRGLSFLSCMAPWRDEHGHAHRNFITTDSPFMVIELDVYVCRILTGDGVKASFSYRDYWRHPDEKPEEFVFEDYSLYSFKELKEEE